MENEISKAKVTFGLTPANIEVIEQRLSAFPQARYSYQTWCEIGKEIGWEFLTAALWYFDRCAQQSAPLSLVVDLVEEITSARNRLYDNVPTGQIEAFQLITLISSHLKDIDAILTKAQPFMPKTGEDGTA